MPRFNPRSSRGERKGWEGRKEGSEGKQNKGGWKEGMVSCLICWSQCNRGWKGLIEAIPHHLPTAETTNQSVSGARFSGITPVGQYSTVGFLSSCSASTINLPCHDNKDNPRSHIFLWSTVRNEILWESGSAVLISIRIFLVLFLWSPKQSNLFPKIPLQTSSSHTTVISSNPLKKGEKKNGLLQGLNQEQNLEKKPNWRIILNCREENFHWTFLKKWKMDWWKHLNQIFKKIILCTTLGFSNISKFLIC